MVEKYRSREQQRIERQFKRRSRRFAVQQREEVPKDKVKVVISFSKQQAEIINRISGIEGQTPVEHIMQVLLEDMERRIVEPGENVIEFPLDRLITEENNIRFLNNGKPAKISNFSEKKPHQ